MPFIRGKIGKDGIGSPIFGSEAEGFVSVVHAPDLPSNEGRSREEIGGVGRFQRVQRFLYFSIRVGELGCEMRRVTHLWPSFSNIRTDCLGRTTALVDQRIGLVLGPTFGGFQNGLL